MASELGTVSELSNCAETVLAARPKSPAVTLARIKTNIATSHRVLIPPAPRAPLNRFDW